MVSAYNLLRKLISSQKLDILAIKPKLTHLILNKGSCLLFHECRILMV